MSVINQLKEIRHYLRLNQSEMSEKLGVPFHRIQNLETGKAKSFTVDELSKLELMGFASRWLTTNQGEMLSSKKATLDSLRQMIAEKEKTATVKTSDMGEIITIPYYRHVTPSAGYGLEMYNEQADGAFPVPLEMFGIAPKMAANIVIMYVSGYSMTPRIDDGDGLLVNIKEVIIRNEGIYVLRWGDSLMVKIVQRIKNGIRLISNNPEFAPVELTDEDCDDVQLIGRVIGMFAKL